MMNHQGIGRRSATRPSSCFLFGFLVVVTQVICWPVAAVADAAVPPAASSDSLCSTELSHCLSQKVAVETRESILQENMAAVSAQRIAMETNLEERNEQLRLLQQDYQRLEVKYKEDLERTHDEAASLREIHTTQLSLILEKNTELENLLSKTEAEKQAALDHVHVLLKQVEIFTEQHQDVVELSALKESCAAAATEHQKAAESWTDDRELLLNNHATALETARNDATAKANDNCNQKIQNQMASWTTTCNEQLAVRNEACRKQVAHAATCHDAVATCQANCTMEIETAVSSQEAIARQWKRRHERLLESKQATVDEASVAAEQLQRSRDELYEVRQELFQAKEQLRKPRIQRRLLIAWAFSWTAPAVQWVDMAVAAAPAWIRHAQEEQYPSFVKTIVMVKDILEEAWVQAVDVFRETVGWHTPIRSRGMVGSKSWYETVLLNPYQRYALPVYTGSLLPFYQKEVIPFYRNTAEPFYHEHVVANYVKYVVPFYATKVAPIYHVHMLPFYQERVLPMYTEGLLPFYRESIVPVYTQQILPVYYAHVRPIYDNHVIPSVKESRAFLVRSLDAHEQYTTSIAASLAWISDVIADYGILQEYMLLSAGAAWLRDHAVAFVRCVEGFVLALLLPLLLRKRKLVKK